MMLVFAGGEGLIQQQLFRRRECAPFSCCSQGCCGKLAAADGGPFPSDSLSSDVEVRTGLGQGPGKGM